MQGESLGKSFHSLSFNFQKVSNFTQFHTTNHTSNHSYLINITFQNLEFWDVTGHYRDIYLFISIMTVSWHLNEA